MTKIFIIFLLFFSCLKLFTFQANASNMSDGNYILDLEKTYYPSPTPVKQVEGISNQSPQEIKGDGFTVDQGFSYVFGLNDFTFSLSPLLIDYGILSPTNPIIRTQIFTVDTGSSFSYSITALEDHELTLQNGNTITIPSATCDDGLCSTQFESNWSNPLTYGFGYSCSPMEGNDCIIKQKNYFRHFPNFVDNDNPENIIEGVGSDKTKKSQLLYKVNVATTQPSGLYSNTITYLAIPGY